MACDSVGKFGGILEVWDPNVFVKHHVSKSDYFLILEGLWKPSNSCLMLISVYAPQDLREFFCFGVSFLM